MKPVELVLTGFRSYPSPVTVDFSGRSLVAVLGDTGAGKSSLLDAITYALFRKSSWDAKEPRQLIADGAEAMSVKFTFLHDGHRWRVHRAMHATNPNAGRHHLSNLDTGQEEDGAGAVDARIRAVLQMGYDTFLRVGLLPQGKFDQLLTATTKERTARLRELFGADALETVRQVAVSHCLRLNRLLADAKIKRATMPDNPALAAAAAGAAAFCCLPQRPAWRAWTPPSTTSPRCKARHPVLPPPRTQPTGPRSPWPSGQCPTPRPSWRHSSPSSPTSPHAANPCTIAPMPPPSRTAT